jgi:hypothetical protein
MNASSYFCFHFRQLFTQCVSFALSSFTATCCMFTIQTAHNSTAFEPKQSVITHLLKMTNTFKMQNTTDSFLTQVTQHRTSPSSVQEGGYHEGVFMSLFRTDTPLNSTNTTTCHILAHPSCTYEYCHLTLQKLKTPR